MLKNYKCNTDVTKYNYKFYNKKTDNGSTYQYSEQSVDKLEDRHTDLGYVLVWHNMKIKYQLMHWVLFSCVLFLNKFVMMVMWLDIKLFRRIQ